MSTTTTNPDPESTPAPNHSPPSLPPSPLPKRTKTIAPIDATPSHLRNTFDDDQSRAATPTPLAHMTAEHSHTHHQREPHAMGSAQASNIVAALGLQVQLLSHSARAPTRGSAFAAGHDLYSAREIVVPARGRARVDTDIAIAVPAGTYGRIAPRSGLAAKHGIDTMAGVIDADYRGQVGVILANLSDADFEIKIGDRIAQLIIEKIMMPEVLVVEKLDESVRGAGGFGSTGGFGAAN